LNQVSHLHRQKYEPKNVAIANENDAVADLQQVWKAHFSEEIERCISIPGSLF